MVIFRNTYAILEQNFSAMWEIPTNRKISWIFRGQEMAVFYRTLSNKGWELKQKRGCSINVLSICCILDSVLF